jgi:hypothetical protein
MEIGGRDVTFRWEMTSQRLKLVLAYIKLAWPEARFVVDPSELAGDPPSSIPSLTFVHMNQKVYEDSRKLGVTPELESFIVNMNVDAEGIDFVIGPEEHCAGESLICGVINTLQANWVYP